MTITEQEQSRNPQRCANSMKPFDSLPDMRPVTLGLSSFICLLFLGQGALFAAADEQNIKTARPDLPENLLRYGPLDVGFGGRASLFYDDNIFIRPEKESDLVWSIAPGINLGMGDYRERKENLLALRYTPTFNFFTDNSDQNSIDHDVVLRGKWRPGPWTLALSQAYQKFSEPVIDVGNRVERDIYLTDLAVAYEISPKTSVEVGGQQKIADYHRLISYNEWEALGWLDYRLTPLLRLGAGGSAGWVDVEESANQMYQRGMVRADYTLSELLEFRGSAGIERREYQDNESDDYEGIFTLGGTYWPRETTSFTLDAFRRPEASVRFRDQNYVLTGFRAGAHQTISEIYTLHLATGYEHAQYNATSEAVIANRKDDYFLIRAGFDWTIRERVVLGVFYLYRQNVSNDAEFEFDNHQGGIEVALKF